MVMRVFFRSICSRSRGIAVISLDLSARADALLAGPGADDVQRSEVVGGVVRAATGLAVDGDEAFGGARVGRRGLADPGLEAVVERLGLEGDQDSA